MKKEDVKYGAYVQILKEELVPAMGCTEPIALAYAAAKAREILGSIPDKVVIEASGSIIKNVKSVIVPNTNHLKGIPAAATAGIIAGRAEKELEVIAQVTESEIEQMKQFLQTADIKVVHADNGITFDIIVSVYKGSSYAKVRIANYHTNIVLMEKDGEVLYEIAVEGEKEEGLTDRNLLNMKDIWDFAMTVDVKGFVPDCSTFQTSTFVTVALVGMSVLMVSAFKSCNSLVRYLLISVVLASMASLLVSHE